MATLTVEREALRQRLDGRFDAMIERGALEEVKGLAYRRLAPALPAMRALGVPPLLRALYGETALASAVAEAKADTKRYAKRQETFFRHQLPAFPLLVPEEAERTLLRAAEAS